MNKMSDQDVTYSTVRFHMSSGLQNVVRPDETQGPREAAHRERSVPWKLMVMVLGVLCFLLLLTVAVLLTQIFQYRQEKHELKKNLNNLTQMYSTLQNKSYLNNEILRNNSPEYDASKQQKERDSIHREQNRCFRETKMALECSQPTGKRVEGHLFCCGIKCYYFIMDNKRWSGCKQTCQDCGLSFLKIHDDCEMKLLRDNMSPNNYWIGSSYNMNTNKWTWVGGHPSKLDTNISNFNSKEGRCVFLSKTRLENISCEKDYSCICEKRMDKFLDSLSNKS
ncbi:killer cell lectin-like receptor 2 [Acomys russatus]|uniref:killer cell lectin-like receptor 2 n=1 Tax=Acomys russatus TaxID=60746 RepID=UPI0021E1CF36|nr:killer cell lectin-like receptor 2 [Acomys russatus]